MVGWVEIRNLPLKGGEKIDTSIKVLLSQYSVKYKTTYVSYTHIQHYMWLR